MSDHPDPGSFVIVGAGAVASALGPALVHAGYTPVGVMSRGVGRARLLADRLGCEVVSGHGLRADLVVLCVPDDAIASVVADCAQSEGSWEGIRVCHVSGAQSSDVLDPLSHSGAVTFSFHPVQTFVFPSGAADLEGVSVGIGGTPAGIRAGTRLAERLGLRPMVISEDRRALYHLATALASNGLVTLAAIAEQCLAACEISAEDARAALSPLVSASAAHLADAGPERSLTGPVVRGDLGTVASHFLALSALIPDLVPLYAALTVETARLAVSSGRLDTEVAAELLASIASRLTRPPDGRVGRTGEQEL